MEYHLTYIMLSLLPSNVFFTIMLCRLALRAPSAAPARVKVALRGVRAVMDHMRMPQMAQLVLAAHVRVVFV
jgi:hypothetical protein